MENKFNRIASVLIMISILTLSSCGNGGNQGSGALVSDAASQVYVPPGQYDEFYDSSQVVSAVNCPSMDCHQEDCLKSFLFFQWIRRKVTVSMKKQSPCLILLTDLYHGTTPTTPSCLKPMEHRTGGGFLSMETIPPG